MLSSQFTEDNIGWAHFNINLYVFFFFADLAGKNNFEEAECIMVVNCLEDVVVPMIDCYHHIRTDIYPENDASKLVCTKI